ncbi:hypothetical protein [Flavobacterium acetivorans]|uniref:hypothetical protein n=1 Tax=Flavobacterium acetivorans TaxID=2893883 RepID=UPI001E2D31C8|nr:hypothetical protein [Flavobacterium sp. F-29]UFH35079.1 hypothetical protein LNP19_13450 [Flavobacterium sp. F-29]
MSRNYKFQNPEGLYFISFTHDIFIVFYRYSCIRFAQVQWLAWLDVFARNEYKDLFLESLIFCQKSKGLEIHAWCTIELWSNKLIQQKID